MTIKELLLTCDPELDRDIGVVFVTFAHDWSIAEEAKSLVVDDIEISGDLAIIYCHKENSHEY